jgi:hypothetical protein
VIYHAISRWHEKAQRNRKWCHALVQHISTSILFSYINGSNNTNEKVNLQIWIKNKQETMMHNLYYNSAQSLPFSPYHSKMVLLNGPPLSNFVDRGLGEWEWLGPGSTKIITLCNTPKNLPTLVLAPSLFPHSLNYPPFLSSVPLSHTLTMITCFSRGTSQWPSAMGTH